MHSILQNLLNLLVESTPAFAGGLVLGSLLEVFLPRRWAERWLAAGPQSLVLATIAGALLPGCAMSTVPLARSLRARGASLGTVSAFLLIAPLISPHTIALTAVLLGAGFAVTRVVLPLLFTLAFGLLVDAFRPRSPTLGDTAADCGCRSSCGCNAPPAPPSRSRLLATKLVGNLRALAPIYLGSLVLVAALGACIDPADLARHSDGPLAYGAALALGIPLYVCDGGEVPLTRGLLELGVGPGPAFTFLLGSVGTCLATITMAFGIIGRRLTVAYVAGTLALALLGGLLVAACPPLHPHLPPSIPPHTSSH